MYCRGRCQSSDAKLLELLGPSEELSGREKQGEAADKVGLTGKGKANRDI